jgi:hypothetical protein
MVGKVTDNCKLSASLVPAIMGYDKWRTPNDALALVKSHIDGTATPWEGNEATEWGNRLEPVIVKELAKRLKIKDYNDQIDYAVKHGTLEVESSWDAEALGQGQIIRTDPENGIFCMGTDQIELSGPGPLEVKTTSYRPEDSPDLGRGPLQLTTQMMCGNATWGALGILYQGITLRCFVFVPHEKTIKAITDAVNDFDSRLRSDPTRWYSIENSADALLIFGEGDDETPKPLDPSFAKLAEEYLALRAVIKEGEEAIKVINAKVQSEMGNHTTASSGGYEFKWPVRHFKAQPEKVVPAKEASSKRQSTITVKEMKK